MSILKIRIVPYNDKYFVLYTPSEAYIFFKISKENYNHKIMFLKTLKMCLSGSIRKVKYKKRGSNKIYCFAIDKRELDNIVEECKNKFNVYFKYVDSYILFLVKRAIIYE